VCLLVSVVLSPLILAQEAGSEEVPAEEPDDPILDQALTPWTGDLDGILKRGMLRVAIPYGLMTYFNDGPEQRGLTYDYVMAFEQTLKKRIGKEAANLTVVIVPTNRARLLPMLTEGLADLAAGTITVTEERRALVEFSEPFHTAVREVLVLGPAAPEVKTAEDMLASKVYLRPSTSFYEHLTALNAKRVATGKAPFPIEDADENLTDDDLIEMVGAGIIPATIADEPVAKLFAEVFDGVRVHDDLVLASDQHIAWAMRKDSPKLKALVDDYVAQARKGTKLGNILLAKYLKSAEWAKNALADADRQRFEGIAELLRTYAGKYDFDWLMIAAQGYQESRLDQSKRSPVGAVGVMQVMPATARDPNVGIPDIHRLEANIHAGVKYLRFLRDRYYSDPSLSGLNQTLFSFAAYNAGPGNVAKARKRAEKLGLDPDVWLDNVEIAAAKVVSREPVVYVRNIYKYYIAYKLLTEGKAGAAKGGSMPTPAWSRAMYFHHEKQMEFIARWVGAQSTLWP
jgi:membrane-bound lytic murein transglycosylase MltF